MTFKASSNRFILAQSGNVFIDKHKNSDSLACVLLNPIVNILYQLPVEEGDAV